MTTIPYRTEYDSMGAVSIPEEALYGPQTQRPVESWGKKWSCTMTFLPKSAEVRQELLTLLIAVPMSLIGTGFLFFLADVGNRAIGA